MIDVSFYDDMHRKVNKKCKKLYKKGFFDTSWKSKSNEVMKSGISEIWKFLEN